MTVTMELDLRWVVEGMVVGGLVFVVGGLVFTDKCQNVAGRLAEELGHRMWL